MITNIPGTGLSNKLSVGVRTVLWVFRYWKCWAAIISTVICFRIFRFSANFNKDSCYSTTKSTCCVVAYGSAGSTVYVSVYNPIKHMLIIGDTVLHLHIIRNHGALTGSMIQCTWRSNQWFLLTDKKVFTKQLVSDIPSPLCHDWICALRPPLHVKWFSGWLSRRL